MRQLRSLAASLLALIACAGSAAAQAVLHPNQIVGEVSFTNENPAIRAYLDELRSRAYQRSVSAHGEGLAAYTTVHDSNWAGDYELTVESSDSGILYDVQVTGLRSDISRSYTFAARRSAAVHPEPAADVELDFAECAAMVRVRFTPEGEPPPSYTALRADRVVSVGGEGTLGRSRGRTGEAVADLAFRAIPEPVRITAEWMIGGDDELDRIRLIKQWEITAGCDEIVELSCVSVAPPTALGAIAGDFDVVGEPVLPVGTQRTRVRASGGPWGNYRHFSMSDEPATGRFLLPNLLASDVVEPAESYEVSIAYRMREGLGEVWATSPDASAVVIEGETTDLGSHFVMEPGWLHGDVRLIGGPGRAPLGPMLGHFAVAVDEDEDGLPDRGSGLFAGHSNAAISGGARGSSTEGASATTALLGSYDGDLEGIDANFALPLAAPGAGPHPWLDPELRLRFEHEGDSPETFLLARMQLNDRHSVLALSAGERLDYEQSFCLGQVELVVTSTDGTFSIPEVAATRRIRHGELDYRGLPVRHSATVSAKGTPRGEMPHSDNGLVLLPLVEGAWWLATSVSADNPGGGVSRSDLRPVELELGCGHHLRVRPELVAWIASAPPCGEAGLAEVVAELHGIGEIVSATVSVNGGPEQLLCSPCGSDARVEGFVRLEPGDNEITVVAIDDLGRDASATAFARAVTEPSALELRPDADPLLIARDGEELLLDWEGIPDQDAALQAGTIESLWQHRSYDHAPLTPCPGRDGHSRISAGDDSRYFLISARCGWGTGAPGRDSFGRPRSIGRGSCP